MPEVRFYLLFVTALIPLIVGYFYYNPKVFGRAWMQASGVTEEDISSGSSLKIFGLSYLFSLMLSYIIFLFAVHQSSIFQLFLHEPDLQTSGTEINNYITDFFDKYGSVHRTFGHGVIHGIELCGFMGFALIGINTLFERRPMKYMWIHLGYWIICGALMGGVLCAWM